VLEEIGTCPYCGDKGLAGSDACPVCGRESEQPAG
jgi:RNA polymerase subunit RPABC4/transcription elongation factor Spt4